MKVITYDGKLDKLLKKISPAKDILIICKKQQDVKKIVDSGFIIKNINQNEITITTKKDSIKSNLVEILNKLDIEDLYINEPPIDEIIGEILIKGKV